MDCFVPTNDEFFKLVIISLFKKSNFSCDSRNDDFRLPSLRGTQRPLAASVAWRNINCYILIIHCY